MLTHFCSKYAVKCKTIMSQDTGTPLASW